MENDQWLNLSQAADLLGVHPSTVRLWSDKGILPVHRTHGRHRRYRRSEVELWAEATRQKHPLEVDNVVQHTMRRMRIQIGEGHIEAEPWYQKLDEEARGQYRKSGRSLVQGLATYLTAEGDDAIAEARAIGYEYASRARSCQLDISDAVRAFLFFRNLMLEAIVSAYQEANVPSGAPWQAMLQRVHTFTDQIMLSLLETYKAFEKANH